MEIDVDQFLDPNCSEEIPYITQMVCDARHRGWYRGWFRWPYLECCIEFFIRCRILGILPTDKGAEPDPVEEGYIRCPACVAQMKEEAKQI